MNESTRKLTFSALLVSVMLVLGYVESLIPIPGIPGVKLGLSNSVLMLALYWMGVPSACVLMVCKVLLSGLMFGGVTSMLYAFVGGALSLAVMSLLIFLLKGFSPVGVGVAGAVSHNLGQVLVAIWVLGTSQLIYYLAVLTLIGLATGAATGTLAMLLMKHIPPSVRQGVQKPSKRSHEPPKQEEKQ